ncbi:hypothetical protein [Gloeothece verrucosa]|uniref:Uncharacterized protein n=1 Tax=Gloeothece verrucosa (strain PCC 7822) TaxID=497965 RepID=E0UN68_GLOV7|nr:hypothetical protein [Gloeothece verrucosa]ADN18398.1 hypothetical protein Cyan7822_6720 [Gloeothece verrucosa PCC 7822]
MDGYIEKLNEEERFSFTWEGSDEMDEASGSGWIKLAVPNEIEGVIKLSVRRSIWLQSQKSLKTNQSSKVSRFPCHALCL